jgi:hypothetical protein
VNGLLQRYREVASNFCDSQATLRGRKNFYGLGGGAVGRGLGVGVVLPTGGVGVGVSEGVGVAVGVAEAMAVAVAVAVGVALTAAVDVAVGVGVVGPQGVALDAGVGETLGVGPGVPTAAAISTRPQPKTLFGGVGPPGGHKAESIPTAELSNASRLASIWCCRLGMADHNSAMAPAICGVAMEVPLAKV